ncbi:MAG: FtsW/RodA/SpoVE family cell cycle protein [Alistipes sp.]
MTANRHNSIFYGVDLWTVLLYVLIVMAGWVSITSASYDEGTADVFSFSHFYMKQLMWIGVAWTTAVVVLLLDDRFYHMFAYPAYFAGLALLVGALLFGREVNGAKAWFEFGSFRMQPVEFVKIATALALARVMSATLLDQPAGRPVQGRDGDLRPAVYHHPAERYRFGHRARVVPLRALPRRAQQVALHPGAADRRAVHLLVPAFAHDDARVDHSGLHPFAGDDERPLAPMLRLPCRAGTGEHPALHGDGACRAGLHGSACLPLDRDAAVAGLGVVYAYRTT